MPGSRRWPRSTTALASPASVRFTDIVGLVRGASQWQGLGNQFLGHIRETDAICQVVRVFADPDVVRVEGSTGPKTTSRLSSPS